MVASFALLAFVAIACGVASPAAGDPAGGALLPVHALPGVSPGEPVKIEMVSFADRRHAPVQVVRGSPRPEAAPAGVEFLGFGSSGAQQVRVIRGPVARVDVPGLRQVETVNFTEPGRSPVMVVRGGVDRQLAIGLFEAAGGRRLERQLPVGLFEPATGSELDRIAFAVDGAESSHGRNPLMWRPTLAGPQGPMQVSLKAALDVGGGDRFDLQQNRLLGRAYLAQMFRRYGNWPDALAAYNWGPGNIDGWIAEGRPSFGLPNETARYVRRVLRDALVAGADRW
jgi:hypothetical protein